MALPNEHATELTNPRDRLPARCTVADDARAALGAAEAGWLITGGFSEAFFNGDLRPGYTQAAWGNSFVQRTRPLSQAVEHVLSGWALVPHRFKGSRRTNDTFESTDVFALDLESAERDVSVADAQANAFLQPHALLIHSTKSSGIQIPDHNDHGYLRSRAYGRFSERIEGVERARTLLKAVYLASGLPADKASFKPAQPWFGSTNRVEQPHVNLEATPVDVWWVAGYLLDEARAEMERDLAPKPPTIKPTTAAHFTWIERKASDRVDAALGKLAHASNGDRHDTLISQCYWLAGNAKGGWPVGDWQGALRRTALDVMGEGRSREIERAIRDAKRDSTAIMLELPAPAPSLRVVKRTPAPTTSSSLYFHADGIPLSWHKAVCKASPGNKSLPKYALLHFEAQRQKLIDSRDYTMTQLLAARDALGVTLSDTALKAAMKVTEGLFWNLNWKEMTSSNSEKTSGGRPAQHFQALTLVEIEQALPRWADKRIEEARHQERGTVPNLTAEMIDVLEGDARTAAQEIAPVLPPMSELARTSAWLARKNLGELARQLKDLRSVPIPLDCEDVRAALLAAEIDPDTQRSYTEIKRDYGLSKGSVAVTLKRAGLQAEVQTVACAITSAATFEREVFQARKEQRGFPRALVEIKPSGAVVEHYYDPADQAANRLVIEAAQQAGSTISVKLQTANKYRRVDPAAQQAAIEPRVTFRAPNRKAEQDTIKPYYGVGYNPSVVRHWLKIHLRRLKWHELPGNRFVNSSGEIFDLSDKDFITFAESLGAVITPLVKELA